MTSQAQRFFSSLGHKQSRRFLAPLALFLAILSLPCSASGVSQGYVTSDPDLRPGMVVALSDSGTPDTPSVERASQDAADKIIGVATGADDTLVTIASGSQQVYVQSSGVAVAFVSDVNGSIKKGDQVSISPIKGVLMRSEASGVIVGLALEDFPSQNAESQQISTSNGQQTVLVARLSISLDGKLTSNAGRVVDSSLARLGRAIVGKEVNEIQVVIAVIIFFIVLVAEGGIIYGAVSSAITSLGRNPMARKFIRRELARVLVIAVLVLLIGLAAVYAVLWI